jgi:hypothetical protein
MPLQTAIITDQAVCNAIQSVRRCASAITKKHATLNPEKDTLKRGELDDQANPINSLTCNHKRPSISFRHHEHSVNPDSCVNFTCAVYLYLRWWHTIFFVKRSSCMESKPSFRFLSGRFKISLHHQCFQSDIRFCF